MERFKFTEAMFTEEPLTVGEMLDITMANDPAVPANPTLQAMIKVVMSRYRGPMPLTFEMLHKMHYHEFAAGYRLMRGRIPSEARVEIPQPFMEGLQP